MGYIATRTPRDIEALIVWALVDNGLGAEFVDKRGALTWRDYGTTIDISSGWSVAAPKVQHEDAERIAAAIVSLPTPAMVELVIRHGRANCRPDWCEEGVGHAALKTNRRGQVEWHYERPGDRKSRKLEPKRIWVGETAERVEWYRARYTLWWRALEALVGPLNAVLTRYEALPPRAPEEPWTVRVFDMAGEEMRGMLGEDASMRRAELAAAGDIELPMLSERNANLQAGESAGSGSTHGRT